MSGYQNDRWYQIEANNALFEYLDTHQRGNPLIAMPTGSGKGYVIAKFAKTVLEHFSFRRILIVTHVKELIRQNYDKLRAIWPNAPAGIYSAGLNMRDLSAPITFAGVASIVKIIELFGHFDVMIIDEAHLLGPSDESMYQVIIAALQRINPWLRVIGLTATPYRTGMGLLTNGEIFTDICYDVCTVDGFSRMFADYHLVPPRAQRGKTQIDTGELRITAGDYSQASLQKATSKDDITWQALQEALQKGQDKGCRLVFCAGVDHANTTAHMCRALGLRAEAVHTKMSPSARDDVIKGYLNGEIDTLTNNGIFTTGQDYAAIDHIIMLRPTMSVGLWVQMVGRGTRPYEVNGWRKSECLVSDHAGNAKRLGPIDDPLIPKLKGKGGGEAPVKICEACDNYNYAGARVCAYCGEPFVFQFRVATTAHDDIIVKSDPQNTLSDLPQFEMFTVNHVYYTYHTKKNATANDKPTIKVSYRCGLLGFIEYIAIEHAGGPRQKAKKWWKQRYLDDANVPETVTEAMTHIDRLAPPKRIKVWVNKKYPEVVDYEF